MRREAVFQTYFRHWLKSHPMVSGAFELKQTTTNSFPFRQLRDHQENALFASTCNGGFLYKIPDDSISVKPFDMFYLRNADAYVVIKYPKDFVIIPITVFAKERMNGLRDSLTYERARELSIKKEERILI